MKKISIRLDKQENRNKNKTKANEGFYLGTF